MTDRLTDRYLAEQYTFLSFKDVILIIIIIIIVIITCIIEYKTSVKSSRYFGFDIFHCHAMLHAIEVIDVEDWLLITLMAT